MSTKNWVKRNGKYVDPETGREVVGWLAKDGRVSGVARKGFGKDNERAIFDTNELKAEQRRFGGAINLKTENTKVTSSKNVAKGELFTFADADKNWDPEDPRAYRVGQLEDGSWVYSKGDAKPSETAVTKALTENEWIQPVATIALSAAGMPFVALALNAAANAHLANQGYMKKEQFWKGLAVDVATAGYAQYGPQGAAAQAVGRGAIQAGGAKWQGASWSEAAKAGGVSAAASYAGSRYGAGAGRLTGLGTTAGSAAAAAGTAYAFGSALGMSHEQLRAQAISSGISAAVSAQAMQSRAEAATKAAVDAAVDPQGVTALDVLEDYSTGGVVGDAQAAPAINAPPAATGAAPVAPQAPEMGPIRTRWEAAKAVVTGRAPAAPGGAALGGGARTITSEGQMMTARKGFRFEAQPVIGADGKVSMAWAEVPTGKSALEVWGPLGLQTAVGVYGIQATKSSSDKALKYQKESTAAQLKRSDEATARTAALQEEYFATAERDASNRVKVSSVWQ